MFKCVSVYVRVYGCTLELFVQSCIEVFNSHSYATNSGSTNNCRFSQFGYLSGALACLHAIATIIIPTRTPLCTPTKRTTKLPHYRKALSVTTRFVARTAVDWLAGWLAVSCWLLVVGAVVGVGVGSGVKFAPPHPTAARRQSANKAYSATARTQIPRVINSISKSHTHTTRKRQWRAHLYQLILQHRWCDGAAAAAAHKN